MLRALVHGLVFLHLGPAIAFALLAFGCGPGTPDLALCGKGPVAAFALLTTGAWLVLLLASAAVHLARRTRRAAPPAAGLRASTLLACLATGALLAAAGTWLTGMQHWLLTLPGVLALGWLALANPLACAPGSPADASQADGP